MGAFRMAPLNPSKPPITPLKRAAHTSPRPRLRRAGVPGRKINFAPLQVRFAHPGKGDLRVPLPQPASPGLGWSDER